MGRGGNVNTKIYSRSDNEFEKLIKSVPIVSRDEVKSIKFTKHTHTRKYFDHQDNLIFRNCSECMNVKSRDLFMGFEDLHLTTPRKVTRICSDCRGVVRNSSNDVKCVVCESPKDRSLFSDFLSKPKHYRLPRYGKPHIWKWKTLGVCNSCYSSYPNNHITRPNELFSKSSGGELILMRVYNEHNTFIKKRCRVCKELKSVQKYTLSKKEKDGLTLVCQDCLIKQRKETDFKYRSKKDLPLYGYVKQWELLNNKKLQTDFFNEWDELSIGMDKRNLMKVRSSLMEKYQIRDYTIRNLTKKSKEFYNLYFGWIEKKNKKNEKIRKKKFLQTYKEIKDWGKTLKKIGYNHKEIVRWKNEDDKFFDSFNKIKITRNDRVIPRNLEGLYQYHSHNRRLLYDSNENVVFKECKTCGKHKSVETHFNKKKETIGGYSSNCNDCIRLKKGLPVSERVYPYDIRNGKRIKVRNSFGRVIKKRCNSCDELKPIKDYNHSSYGNRKSICESCFVELPGNHITRKVEFYVHNGERVRIRKYDPKTNRVIEKRCTSCKEMLTLDNFTIRRSNKIDGRSVYCIKCRK